MKKLTQLIIDLPTKKLNRLMKRRPRFGLTWCHKCDRNHVEDGRTCTECGAKPLKPHASKPSTF